jgi:D-3-phosphoglycerate dehydrogenase
LGEVVLVTTRSFGSGDADPVGLLESASLKVVRAAADHDPDSLRGRLAAAAAWIAGNAPVEERHLALAPDLKVIARYGAGVDSVDLAAAERRGITVTNTPGANTEAVADHAVGLMIAALRHFLAGDRAVRSGERPVLRGRELRALTVGLVGFGNIGKAVARRLVGGFGSRVAAYDPYVSPAEMRGMKVEPVALDELAAASDVLSLHLPGGSGPLIDKTFLRSMKPGAVLVNTARGDLLDERAVARALSEGQLAAAACDVLTSEQEGESPLLAAPNTLLTPHVAAQTVQAIDRMGMMAAEEVVRVLAGEPARHPVVLAERAGRREVE